MFRNLDEMTHDPSTVISPEGIVSTAGSMFWLLKSAYYPEFNNITKWGPGWVFP